MRAHYLGGGLVWAGIIVLILGAFETATTFIREYLDREPKALQPYSQEPSQHAPESVTNLWNSRLPHAFCARDQRSVSVDARACASRWRLSRFGSTEPVKTSYYGICFVITILVGSYPKAGHAAIPSTLKGTTVRSSVETPRWRRKSTTTLSNPRRTPSRRSEGTT
jgi:hypothetical protein